jgi:hypothetical protein
MLDYYTEEEEEGEARGEDLWTAAAHCGVMAQK